MKKLLLLAISALVLTTTAFYAPPSDPVLAPINLSSKVPGDVDIPKNTPVSIEAFQPDFDVYSWNTFIALNWPVKPDGQPDDTKQIGADADGDNATVWEHYRDVSDVFLAKGPKGEVDTPKWDGSSKRKKPIVTQIAKTPLPSSEPFNTGPLIDQNGVYTRFQILINKNMFEYIVKHKLYSKAGQEKFKSPVKFDCGSLTPNVEGAIMVKSAWKELKPGDNKSRFHTEEMTVCSEDSTKPSCHDATMGLVGLHIAHKTNSASQWLWSTFEQVDNAPTAEDVKDGKTKDKHYNYYNPNPPADRPPPQVNQIPPRPWNPAQISDFHTQVVRNDLFNNPIYAKSAADQNKAAHKLLTAVNSKSVWQYYELISTMWPTNSTQDCKAKPADPIGAPAPTFLANTTLETYLQSTLPQPNVSSQCILCHKNATMTTPIDSDFTYILQRAK